MGHRFNPEHAKKLDNEERRKMLPPDQIIRFLSLNKEDIVLDLGAGTGYFSIPISKQVEKVIAVDVSEEMLSHFREKLNEEDAGQIELVHHQIETLPFEDHFADKVLVSLVMHEVSDLNQTIREIRRVLKQNGKLVIIEWEKKESESGPPIEERLLSTEFKQILKGHGFTVTLERPNEDQYLLICDQ